MRSRSPEPKGKLDAMTGYSFTTPVWEGGQWVVPAVAGVTVKAARIVNGPEDQPRDAPAQWDRIDWRAQEEQVRRLRQRIFKASQEQDWPTVRNLQKLTAPRGALSYPRLSREEFEGRFLGLMPYLELKGEGNRSMAGN
jgi:N-terminal domain of reverse transcriptase